MLVFFLPLFPLGVSRFARAIRGRESKAIRSERTLVSQTALLDSQQRSAKVGPAPGKPVLRRRPRDASFCDDASEYQTEDYVQARQGVGVGPGPASTRLARGERYGAGAPPRDFSARIA